MKAGDVREITVNGEKLTGEYLGKGTFCRAAYRVGDDVYLFVDEDDYSKEIISHIENPHIPPCEMIEHQEERGLRVWKMPFYEKLTARHKQAWADYKRLRNIIGKVRMELIMRAGYGEPRWYEMPGLIAERVDFSQTLFEALESLASWLPSYGSHYAIELPKVNCSVGKDGQLILRDIVFSTELLDQYAAGKRRAA